MEFGVQSAVKYQLPEFTIVIYKKKHNITIKDNFHHAGTIVDLWGVLHVAEANQPGYQIQKLDVAYSEKDWKDRIVVYTPVIPYTPEEQKEINKLAAGFSKVSGLTLLAIVATASLQ